MSAPCFGCCSRPAAGDRPLSRNRPYASVPVNKIRRGIERNLRERRGTRRNLRESPRPSGNLAKNGVYTLPVRTIRPIRFACRFQPVSVFYRRSQSSEVWTKEDPQGTLADAVFAPNFSVLFGVVWCSLAQFGAKKLLLFFMVKTDLRP